jgi:hypothetical protein
MVHEATHDGLVLNLALRQTLHSWLPTQNVSPIQSIPHVLPTVDWRNDSCMFRHRLARLYVCYKSDLFANTAGLFNDLCAVVQSTAWTGRWRSSRCFVPAFIDLVNSTVQCYYHLDSTEFLRRE